MLSTYEIGLILVPETSEKGSTDGIKKIIEKTGAKITGETSWGKKPFTFRIKKQMEGVYTFLTVNAEAPEIVQVSSTLKTHESVLRYLILKSEAKPAAKTAKKEDVKNVTTEKTEEPKKDVKKETKKAKKKKE